MGNRIMVPGCSGIWVDPTSGPVSPTLVPTPSEFPTCAAGLSPKPFPSGNRASSDPSFATSPGPIAPNKYPDRLTRCKDDFSSRVTKLPVAAVTLVALRRATNHCALSKGGGSMDLASGMPHSKVVE